MYHGYLVGCIVHAATRADHVVDATGHVGHVAEVLESRVVGGKAADAYNEVLDARLEEAHDLRSHLPDLVVLFEIKVSKESVEERDIR